jgi:PTH1 family peptidyl-tRNA hydrolase
LKAVFGLGNPGTAYALTRHNVGFEAIDLYRKTHRLRRPGRIESECLVYRDDDLLLCKPLTFMNESGLAVAGVLAKHSVSLADTLIVYDELDLPLGRIKVLAAGGAGTHKGMRSIQAALRTNEVPRLRIGIGVEGRTEPGEAFVLKRFPTDEWSCVVPALERAVDAIEAFRSADVEAVMTRFNRRDDEPGCRT